MPKNYGYPPKFKAAADEGPNQAGARMSGMAMMSKPKAKKKRKKNAKRS